jgi:simple sugar transport system ATP-binding protein
MVHQHFTLVHHYTVAENIVLGMEPQKKILGILSRVDLKGANGRIRELSKKYGLMVEPESIVEELKASARQRVEILKMLYREVEILIFDEPTALLAPQEIEFLLGIMARLRESGKTIILITHKLDEIKRAADRCAIMNRGKLIAVLDVSGTSTREMARLMVGRDVMVEIDKPPASFGEEVLRVEGLTVENDGFKAVKNVSFSIRQGEIFALAGVAGNGQVELADAIAGLASAKSGKIFLNGRDITAASVRERTAAGMAYIPEDRQNVGLVLDFSLSENLALKRYFRKPFSNGSMLQAEAFESYAKRLSEEYDIRGKADTAARSMSGGNQQKAIIAREVDLGCPLMIFVQPTRGLDIGAITSIPKRMVDERAKGKAILLISLELDEIMSCADTIGVMYGGELLRISDASGISVNEVGECMMGVGRK